MFSCSIKNITGPPLVQDDFFLHTVCRKLLGLHIVLRMNTQRLLFDMTFTCMHMCICTEKVKYTNKCTTIALNQNQMNIEIQGK